MNKILNINPIKIRRFNTGSDFLCLHDNIATIAKEKNFRYELMNINKLDFNYKINISNNNISIQNYTQENDFELLEKYHGVKLDYHNNITFNELLDLIRFELSNDKPVIARFDSYWCPWDPEFCRGHNQHTCIVNGIEDDLNIIHFTDAAFLKKGPVPILIFEQGFGYCLTFDIHETEDMKWYEILLEKIQELDIKLIQRYNDFYKDLNIIMTNINKYDETQINNFFEELKDIFLLNAFDINKFASIIFYMADKDERFNEVIEQFREIYNATTMIRSLILKGIISISMPKLFNNILNGINKVILLHKQTMTNIKNICQNKPVAYKTQKDIIRLEYQLSGNQLNIDLVRAYNNNGIGTLNGINSNLTGLGAHIIHNKELSEPIKFNDIEIKLPIFNEKRNDNITCNDQILEIKNDYKCTDIYIFGCSEFGNSEGEFIINYADGKTENILVQFSDFYIWDRTIPDFGGKIVWTGEAVDKNIGKPVLLPGESHIYCEPKKLTHKGIVKNIKLPCVPNLHVFAIVLRIV